MAEGVKRVGMRAVKDDMADAPAAQQAWGPGPSDSAAPWEAPSEISCECLVFGRLNNFEDCCSVYYDAVMEGFDRTYSDLSLGPGIPKVPFFAPLSDINPFITSSSGALVNWTFQDFRGYVQDLATPFMALRNALQKSARGESISVGPFNNIAALTNGEIPNIPRTDLPASGVDMTEILNYIEVFWQIGKDGISTALYGPRKYQCRFEEGAFDAATGAPTWDEDGNRTIFKVCENDAALLDAAAIWADDESAVVGFDRLDLVNVTWPSWSDWGNFFEGVARDIVDLAADFEWGVDNYQGDPFSNNWHGKLLPQFGIAVDIDFSDLSKLDPMANPQGFQVAINNALQTIPLGLEELYESYNWEGKAYREVIDAVSNPGWFEDWLNLSTFGFYQDEFSLIFSPLEGLDVKLEDTYKLIRKLVEKWIPQIDPVVSKVVHILSPIFGPSNPPAQIPISMPGGAQGRFSVETYNVPAMSPPPPFVEVHFANLSPFASGTDDSFFECEPNPINPTTGQPYLQSKPPSYWLNGVLRNVTQHDFVISELGYTPSEWWEDQTDIVRGMGDFLSNIDGVVGSVLELEGLIEDMLNEVGYELKSKLSWLERTIQRLNRHLKLIPDTVDSSELYSFPWPGMDDADNLEMDWYTVSFEPPDWLTDALDGYHEGWEAVISGLNEAITVTRMALSHIEKIQKLLPGLHSQLNIWWNGDQTFVSQASSVQPFSYSATIPSGAFSGWGLTTVTPTAQQGQTSGSRRAGHRQRIPGGAAATSGGGGAQASASYSPVSSQVSTQATLQTAASALFQGNAKDVVADMANFLTDLDVPVPFMLNILDRKWFWDSGWADPQLWYRACCAASSCTKGWGEDQTGYFDSMTPTSLAEEIAEGAEQEEEEQGEEDPNAQPDDPFAPKSKTLNGIAAAYGSAMVLQENLLWKYKWWILAGTLAIGLYYKRK